MSRRIVLLAALAAAFASCGGSGDDADDAASDSPPTSPEAEQDAVEPDELDATVDVGASDPEPIPVTSETLAGIWRVEDPPTGGLLNQIGADGSFVFDPEGVLDTDPWGIGTYELDGTEVIITVTNGACSDWAFRVDDIPEDGQVLATYSRSGCHMEVGEPWNLTRLSPISPSASAIVEPVAVSDAPVELSTEIEGIWLREGTGQLASFTADGRYSVDDGGLLGVDPDDTGHYEIDGDTFVLSTDGRGSCAAGTTVTSTAAIIDSVTFPEDDSLYIRRLRLTAPDNECVGWTSGEQTWLRVSP
jgi:hypothetical protein